MSQNIRLATAEDYPRIMEIWESAVKATHDFLAEEDFNYFKEAIPRDYLPHLEMLFIHNDTCGKGYGKTLYQFVKKL
ncbi:hypothetical protein [Chryseobacterium sp. IT-36CA2]|uniref:hypothetical protein n=1 Tax=Chryseobacterium sp. IT-36CA2 TaxID=3026460 RepID=UPI0039E18228